MRNGCALPFIVARSDIEFSRTINRHIKTAHKPLCPTCNLTMYKGETEETHECPKRMGPGADRPELLPVLLAGSTRMKSSKINRLSGEQGFVCVECGLQSGVLLMMQRHVNLMHGTFR